MPDNPMLAAANQRLRAVAVAIAPATAFTWAVLQHWSAGVWSFASTALRTAGKATAQGAVALLVPLERMLLSHRARERTQAFAVWTLILAFGVTSVDYLLTGGPEFGMGARAAPYVARADLIAARAPLPAWELEFAAPVEPALLERVVAEATVTPTVARTAAPLEASNPPKAEIAHPDAAAADKAKPETEAT